MARLFRRHRLPGADGGGLNRGGGGGPLSRLAALIGRKTDAAAVRSPPAAPPDAFAFRSDLSLAKMKPRLEAVAPWSWWEGDSAWFDYLGARIGPGSRMLRLYPEGDRYLLQVRRGPLDEDVRRLILERLLPAIDASDVAPAEGLD